MPSNPGFIPLHLCVLTVSDSRTLADDRSGDYLVDALTHDGHVLHERALCPDDRYRMRAIVSAWIADAQVDGILITGGTGFTGRDSTPEAITPLLDKTMPGFGELFRAVSVDEIGTSSLQSRAFAGLANHSFVFCLPGSTSACRTALGKDRACAAGCADQALQSGDTASTSGRIACALHRCWNAHVAPETQGLQEVAGTAAAGTGQHGALAAAYQPARAGTGGRPRHRRQGRCDPGHRQPSEPAPVPGGGVADTQRSRKHAMVFPALCGAPASGRRVGADGSQLVQPRRRGTGDGLLHRRAVRRVSGAGAALRTTTGRRRHPVVQVLAVRGSGRAGTALCRTPGRSAQGLETVAGGSAVTQQVRGLHRRA